MIACAFYLCLACDSFQSDDGKKIYERIRINQLLGVRLSTTKIPVDIFLLLFPPSPHICVISNAKRRVRHTFTDTSHIDNNNYYCHSTFVREKKRALIQGKTWFYGRIYQQEWSRRDREIKYSLNVHFASQMILSSTLPLSLRGRKSFIKLLWKLGWRQKVQLARQQE